MKTTGVLLVVIALCTGALLNTASARTVEFFGTVLDPSGNVPDPSSFLIEAVSSIDDDLQSSFNIDENGNWELTANGHGDIWTLRIRSNSDGDAFWATMFLGGGRHYWEAQWYKAEERLGPLGIVLQRGGRVRVHLTTPEGGPADPEVESPADELANIVSGYYLISVVDLAIPY